MDTSVPLQNQSPRASRPQASGRLAQSALDEVCSIIYAQRFVDVPAALDHLHQLNAAHLLMLHATGIIDETAARTLAAELLAIRESGTSSIPMDTSKEDVYFNFEAHLIARVGELVGGKLHTARSRNEMMATAERVAARESLLQLIDTMLDMLDTLLEQAQRHASTVMPGYTHLQPAQPMTYGFYLHAVASAFLRDIDRLMACYPRVNQCPMGGGAFAGVTFPIDRQATAQLLGFDLVMNNTLDAIASRDFSLEILAALHIFSLTSSRVAQDYYIWGSQEFGLFDFPDSIASTSSIMPQKKNPVVLEYLKGRAGHAMGALFIASAAIKGSGFSHSGDANRESLTGFKACVKECLDAAKLLRLIFEHAAPKPVFMRQRAEENFCCVTDVADLLVRDAGLSFRQAHHVVGNVVRKAIEQGLTATGITSDMVMQAGLEVLGHPLIIKGSSLEQALNPDNCVSARPQGGPDPDTTRASIALLQQRTHQFKQETIAWACKLDKAHSAAEHRLRQLARV